MPVGPLGSEGIEAIDGRKDSRPDWDGFAFQAVRITRAVPFFVVGADNGHHGIRELDAIQYLRAHDRVNFHFLELFRGEAPRLRENVLGHGELANVVEHRGGANGVQMVRVQAKLLGNLDRVDLHSPQMIVSGVILRFDCQGKRFDGAQVKRGNFLGVLLLRLGVLLLRFKAVQVGPVGAVDQINDGEGEKTELPADQPVDGAHPTSDQRTEQIIREGPQIAFLPDMDGVASLRHRDDAGNGEGIEGEVGRRCRGYQEWQAKSDTGGDFTVKHKLCGANGEGEVCQIKEPLNRAGTRIGMPQGLDKSTETSHQHRLGIGEVKDADQNKEEIRRHRGLDAWQVHFEYGSAQSDG